MIKIKHLSNLKLPVRASLSYTVAASLSKAAGLLFTPVFTRLLSQGEYGSYTLYISIIGLCTVICTALTSGGAMYKAYSLFPSDREKISSAALGLSIAFAIPLSFAVILFGEGMGLPSALAPLIFIQLICDAAIASRLCALRYTYSYKEAAFLTLFCSLGAPIVSLVLLRAFPGELARALGLLTVSLIAALPTLLSSLRLGVLRPRMWRISAKFSLPMLPGAITTAVISQADKLILAAYLGKEVLASYSVAHSIGIGLTFITGSLGAALQPWMIRKLSAGDDRAVSIVLRDICTSLGALTILVVLLAPEVLLLLTPGSYFSALPAVLPIALAVLPIFTLSSLAIEAIHFSCPLIPALSLTVGALSNLISNVLLIPSIGYIGAGISLLIAYSAANICCYLLLRKKAKIGTLLPRSLIFIFFLTASVSLLGAFLYSELFARIVLIPIPVLILLYVWRSAREYLGEIKA